MPEFYVANLGAVAEETSDGETVLIHFERGTYLSLRESAPTIWAMIQTPMTPDDLLAALAAAYGALPPHAPEAVLGMLDRLCEEGCLLRTDTAASTPGLAVPAVSVPAETVGFAPPVVEVFTDLEDLISIDPVHEVSDAAGWPHRPLSYEVET